MTVTIRDVAREANVAPSTVSRVISNSPDISDKTKKRIRKIIDEMGYHINVNARNLAVKSTQTIGIVMKDSNEESMHDTFFPEVIRGISVLCSKHDYSMSLATGETEEEIFNDTVNMVQGKKVDGLIVLYSKKDDKVVPYLLENNIPFVLIGRPLINSDKITYVNNDNILASKNATRYLIDHGHKKIAYVGTNLEFEVAEARFSGFMNAMSEGKLDVPDNYLKTIENDLEYGKSVISELINQVDRPTAILVTSDLNGLFVLSVLAENNIRVPEDISVISFDDSRIAKITYPPLTSVDIQIFQLGYKAAETVIEQIKDPDLKMRNIIISTIIKERDSCKKMRS